MTTAAEDLADCSREDLLAIIDEYREQADLTVRAMALIDSEIAHIRKRAEEFKRKEIEGHHLAASVLLHTATFAKEGK